MRVLFTQPLILFLICMRIHLITLIANSPYVFIDSILIDPLLNRYEHIPQEGDLFDGMRILVENDLIALDTVKIRLD